MAVVLLQEGLVVEDHQELAFPGEAGKVVGRTPYGACMVGREDMAVEHRTADTEHDGTGCMEVYQSFVVEIHS